jgi:hypothetical protein
MQKNKSAFIEMLFAARIRIIFNCTGLSVHIGARVWLILGLIINQ